MDSDGMKVGVVLLQRRQPTKRISRIKFNFVMAAPQYITRLREMNDEQRQQMFATASTPLRRLIVSEYLAREVYGDEAFEKMYGFKEGPVYKSFKTSALKVLHKWKDGIRRRIFFKKEN